MLRFRPLLSPSPAADVRHVIANALRPGHFFVAPPLRLLWECRERDELFWELFRGRALDHTQTRQRQIFDSWTVSDAKSNSEEEPLLAVRYDTTARQIHVTRSIRCHLWEGYSEGGAVLSRQTIRRVRELVGTISLDRIKPPDDLRDELICLIFHAIAGTSRLPITSVESPLPEFSLGLLSYCYREASGTTPVESLVKWTAQSAAGPLNERESTSLLECVIRGTPAGDIPSATEAFARIAGCSPTELVRDMFNGAALSPYTDFAPKALDFLSSLVRHGHLTVADEIDTLTHLLRQLSRHLSAFDLVRFHHRGANYPDALLLDELLRRTLERAADDPGQFLSVAEDPPPLAAAKRLRRRALRQAWLLCRTYRGHRVPDAPTSPGENARVLPTPYHRVPDDQILDPARRSRQLFADGDPFDRAPPVIQTILRQCVDDLREPAELRELGVGLFLDRSLGFAKAPGEPDQTTMLSHIAFSRGLADSRYRVLRDAWPDLPPFDESVLNGGVRWQGQASRRPGVVSVADAMLAADEFVFLTTTRRSAAELLQHYDFEPSRRFGLAALMETGRCLILPSTESPDRILVYDESSELRAELRLEGAAGYTTRAGVDMLAGGMTLVRFGNGERVSDITEVAHLRPKC